MCSWSKCERKKLHRAELHSIVIFVLQTGLQWTLQRVFLLGVQRTVQPVLRPFWIFSQWHVHGPDQPHVCLCRQPPWMVRFPYDICVFVPYLPSVYHGIFVEAPPAAVLTVKVSALTADPKIEAICGVLCGFWISSLWLNSQFSLVTVIGWPDRWTDGWSDWWMDEQITRQDIMS